VSIGDAAPLRDFALVSLDAIRCLVMDGAAAIHQSGDIIQGATARLAAAQEATSRARFDSAGRQNSPHKVFGNLIGHGIIRTAARPSAQVDGGPVGAKVVPAMPADAQMGLKRSASRSGRAPSNVVIKKPDEFAASHGRWHDSSLKGSDPCIGSAG
jgi:hypothetical protein